MPTLNDDRLKVAGGLLKMPPIVYVPLRIKPSYGVGVFDPLALPGLKLWLKADVGLTLSTTGYAGTGTVTQTGTALVGVGTAFLSEVVVGDAISGTLISGNVTVITDNTNLTLDASNIGAGAAYTITPVVGVSDRVSTWADQSDGGYNLTQAGASLRPIIKTSVQNGLPAVRFDGANDILQNITSIPTLLTGVTLVVVYKSVADNRYVFAIGGYYNGAGVRIRAISPNHTFNLQTVAESPVDLEKSGALSVFHIDVGRYSASNGVRDLRVNGANATNTITASNILQNRTLLFVGGAQHDTLVYSNMNGDVLEVLLYNASITDGQCIQLENYLNARWAIY